jgi:L-fucose isomerase-like protein
MEKIRIYAVSTIQTSFWGSEKGEFFNFHMPRLKDFEEKLQFSLSWAERPVTDQKGAEQAAQEAKVKGADFLLVQSTTFSAGGMIIPFAQSSIPLGIWGVPEITNTGAIPYNSFCGINMYASIIRQYLRKDIPYKWFFGNPDDELFLERFTVTINALRAVKAVRGSRIALVGGVAPGFYDLAFNESRLMEKLGIQIFPHEFGEIKELAPSFSDAEANEQLRKFQAGCVSTAEDLAAKGLENMARVYLAIRKIIEKNGYNSLALGCWPKYRKEFGIVVCAVIGRLLEDGILVACEGDIESLITMIMLKELSGTTPMLMDLSSFDEKDGTILMWHCGSAPNCYADACGVALEGHYKPGSRVPGEDSIRVAGVYDMYYRPQTATVARLSGSGSNLLAFSGDFVEKADRSFDGSRGWIGKLEMEHKPLAIRDLLETVMTGGLQHHYAITAGRVEDALREAAAWLKINKISAIPYSPYMQ